MLSLFFISISSIQNDNSTRGKKIKFETAALLACLAWMLSALCWPFRSMSWKKRVVFAICLDCKIHCQMPVSQIDDDHLHVRYSLKSQSFCIFRNITLLTHGKKNHFSLYFDSLENWISETDFFSERGWQVYFCKIKRLRCQEWWRAHSHVIFARLVIGNEFCNQTNGKWNYTGMSLAGGGGGGGWVVFSGDTKLDHGCLRRAFIRIRCKFHRIQHWTILVMQLRTMVVYGAALHRIRCEYDRIQHRTIVAMHRIIVYDRIRSDSHRIRSYTIRFASYTML